MPIVNISSICSNEHHFSLPRVSPIRAIDGLLSRGSHRLSLTWWYFLSMLCISAMSSLETVLMTKWRSYVDRKRFPKRPCESLLRGALLVNEFCTKQRQRGKLEAGGSRGRKRKEEGRTGEGR